MHLEDRLLHSSYNAVSYLDFILHHFEPGIGIQTCADRRSTFAEYILANDNFVASVVPPQHRSCFMEIPCKVTIKSTSDRSNIAEYIVRNTNVVNFDEKGFVITAIVQYGGILNDKHFVALNGEDFDALDTSSQQLITRPIDFIDTFHALLRGDRPDWMTPNERLSDQTTEFFVNDVALPALCTRPVDVVYLHNMLTRTCKLQMPEPTEWTQQLNLIVNDLQYPMDMCFPSHNEILHGPQINIRLPHVNEAYSNISTSPATFFVVVVPSSCTIQTMTDHVIALLNFHRCRLEGSGIDVNHLLDPTCRQGLLNPLQYNPNRVAGQQQIIEPDAELSSLSFSASFKFGAAQDALVCVSSRDPRQQVTFSRALMIRQGPVLQFVSFAKASTA
jgi:hypothetical protein